MNTLVNDKIKQLLFIGGWKYELSLDESGHRVNHSLAEQRWNEGELTYVDISIADAVMWIYEKHKLWIHVDTSPDVDVFWYEIRGKEGIWYMGKNHKTPEGAYEDGIEFALYNLILKY